MRNSTLTTKNKRRNPSDEARTAPQRVSIKELAKHVNLSPTTVSFVLNDSPGAESIPLETKDRVLAAARRLNYRPNFLARSLRAKRSYVVGVIAPDLSDGYSALVLSGIEDCLIEQDYMFLVATHRSQDRLIEHYPHLLLERHVEGLIAVNTPLRRSLLLPLVAVSGHDQVPGVTNIVLNHDKAAELALKHLKDLGHQQIAFFRGQALIEDSRFRWESIERAAASIGIAIDSELCIQLADKMPSPGIGYEAARALVDRGKRFTALFAFNDVTAIGAIAAFRELGMSVPKQVSVVGFDDVEGASYHVPALTTIRQPLAKMGAHAAEIILQRIKHDDQADTIRCVEVDPELVIRESTMRACR